MYAEYPQKKVCFTVGHSKNHCKATDIERTREGRGKKQHLEATEIGEGQTHCSKTIKEENV